MALSTKQYDMLEAAIIDGTRMSIWRRGTEFMVIPERLRMYKGKELVEARHPSTGQRLELFVEEIEALEVVQ